MAIYADGSADGFSAEDEKGLPEVIDQRTLIAAAFKQSADGLRLALADKKEAHPAGKASLAIRLSLADAARDEGNQERHYRTSEVLLWGRKSQVRHSKGERELRLVHRPAEQPRRATWSVEAR